jgi:hypothetical protein
MAFDYVLDRIRDAEFSTFPFKHLEIDGLFSEQDFAEITSAPEICLGGYPSDESMFDGLFAAGYKAIDFPGCITNHKSYVKWHASRGPIGKYNLDTCEGFGVTLRLQDPVTPVIHDLMGLLSSDAWRRVLADKFDIDIDRAVHDCGVQKYLDGYEISPHPDTRAKALTYMVNINPNEKSENLDHHTRYLTLKDEYSYISHYWHGNETVERCWVPWSWCDVQKQQLRNNSIVIFAPNDDSFHAVRARYDHLEGQRTQIYGNFWRRDVDARAPPHWRQLVIGPEARAPGSRGLVKALTPRSLRVAIGAYRRRGARAADHVTMADRLKMD